MSIIKALSPWIVYIILSTQFHLKLSYVAGIAVLIALISGFNYLKKGCLLNWTLFLSLVIVLLVNLFDSHSWIVKNPFMLVNLLLSLSAWISLAIKKPLTTSYARESAPKEKWNHPVFITINNRVTVCWAVVFTLSLIAEMYAVLTLGNHSIISWFVCGLTIAGLIFSSFYPNYYRKAVRKKVAG